MKSYLPLASADQSARGSRAVNTEQHKKSIRSFAARRESLLAGLQLAKAASPMLDMKGSRRHIMAKYEPPP